MSAGRPKHGQVIQVCVTGTGVMSGLGLDSASFWSGLSAGRSCIGLSRNNDPRLAAKIAGSMGMFTLESYLATHERVSARLTSDQQRGLSATPLPTQLTACAAVQAFAEAGGENIAPERFAHVCAGQNLTLGYYAEKLRSFERHPDEIEAQVGRVALDSDTLAVVGELLSLRGPSFLVGGACASGNLAILCALDLLRSGRADAVLVTGAPASFHPMILHAWTMMEAVTFRSFNDEPTRASRPFDSLREGFVPSEAAAAVVLETATSASTRSAAIRATILGGAATSDACRLPRPNPEGQGRAMRAALDDAGVSVDDVNYVNAHATSTQLGDAVEVAAIKTVFGSRAREIPINATKSMLGHCLTSAGVLELVATVLQIEHGTLHPTINQEQPDPELDLDFVPNVARSYEIETAISNAFGFGGINSCVVVGRA